MSSPSTCWSHSLTTQSTQTLNMRLERGPPCGLHSEPQKTSHNYHPHGIPSLHVIGHGLLAGNTFCQRLRFANQPIADVSWRAPSCPPNIRICFNERSSCKIRLCGGRRPHTVRDSYVELIDTSAGWISCTRKISPTESVENILACTNGN
jgi:hypothetical protein